MNSNSIVLDFQPRSDAMPADVAADMLCNSGSRLGRRMTRVCMAARERVLPATGSPVRVGEFSDNGEEVYYTNPSQTKNGFGTSTGKKLRKSTFKQLCAFFRRADANLAFAVAQLKNLKVPPEELREVSQYDKKFKALEILIARSKHSRDIALDEINRRTN